jgi:redox-sensitive bicupin YhaK (pirin superfamily)
MSTRTLQRVIRSLPTSDGAGVRLRRSLGQAPGMRLDPFLMLDEFSSDNPDDYIAGFPDHPHRGFETLTYMLDGHLLHQDHLGNRGDLKSGGAQWMSAGRGIIHSEMPQQTSGRLRGFQLWINLPAREKMKPASYLDIDPEAIPKLAMAAGGQLKVIAGTLAAEGRSLAGPIQGISSEALVVDVRLPAGSAFSSQLDAGHTAVVYAYEGGLLIGAADDERPLATHEAGVLSAGEQLSVRADGGSAAFLLLAARPIGEPVVQYGPFVMNTRDEIEQAIADYQNGQLV